MKYDYHVIVIGAGSAGLVVASGCTNLGAKVALVEKDKMGGDCLNAGCVPSKTFLKSAHLAKDINKAAEFGLSVAHLDGIDIKKVMERVKSVIASIQYNDSKERYESMGVDVYLNDAVLIDNHSVKIGEKTITAKNIVIATGSGPLVPPIPGLKDIPYLTNKNVFEIEKLPKHLIMLGGGPIGLELGQGFCHLGSKVTIIDMLPGIFPKDDPEVGPIIEKILKEEGIIFSLNSKIKEVRGKTGDITIVVEKEGINEEIKGDVVLVALGRIPNTKGFGLENVGIKLDKKGYIETDDFLRTNIKNIFACGDVVGPFQFTHMAGYQGSIVTRNIIFPFKVKVDYSMVPWTTYTQPEVAHVGYTEPWAKSKGLFKDKIIVQLEKNDRSKIEGEKVGFLKLILGNKNRVIGATIIGKKAGEMIPLAALSIKKKLKPTVFAEMIFSYPTEAEIFKFAAYELIKRLFKPWMKKMVKKIFL